MSARSSAPLLQALALGAFLLTALGPASARADCRVRGSFEPASEVTPFIIRDAPPPDGIATLSATDRGVLWADGPKCAASEYYLYRWDEQRWRAEALTVEEHEEPDYAAVWIRPQEGWRAGEAYRVGVSCRGQWSPPVEKEGCFRRHRPAGEAEIWTQLRVREAEEPWRPPGSVNVPAGIACMGSMSMHVYALRKPAGPLREQWLQLLALGLALALAAWSSVIPSLTRPR